MNVERPYGALSGFDNQSDVIGNQLEYVNKQMSNIKKVANYYRELIEFVAREVKGDQLKEMESIAMGVEIDPLQKDSMYMQGFSFMKRNYVSTLVFSSYNKKILRINILIKSDSYEGVVENLLKKYGESNMLVMRSNDHEWLRYWQSGADFMVINRGDLLWDYGNQRRPMFMTEIGFYFGDNIKEWKDTTFNIIKKNKEDEKIKKMEKSRKKTQAF